MTGSKLFQLHTEFEPKGDQPVAIEKLATGVLNGRRSQVLLGITGSGKTFTMANVIAKVQRPTLILAHNKTLAAQLYQEFKTFFPKIRLNILSLIMITINPKLTFRALIPILKKICQSTIKSIRCA